MTSWHCGLWRTVFRPEGSGGRVSSWVGVGEAKPEGRRCGARRLALCHGYRIYSSCRRWVNRWISPQGLR
jgi:hypothetical protein